METQSSDGLVPDGWTAHLADAIAASLREFAPQLRGTAVVLLQVTCLPWHGVMIRGPQTVRFWLAGVVIRSPDSRIPRILVTTYLFGRPALGDQGLAVPSRP